MTVTENGFVPENITIPLGSSIIFKTTLDKPFWPASDLHPSHSIYPEFDSKRPIQPNREWFFVFLKSGTWDFHDHLAPYWRGAISVIDKNKNNADVDCLNEQTKPCWRKAIFKSLKKKGIDAAFLTVSDLYEKYPQFRAQCHGIVHDIGIEAYLYYLEDEESILTPLASACAYGLYHGFMEALLSEDGNVARARAFCEYIGEKINKKAPDSMLQCFHGIGHGITDFKIRTRGLQVDSPELINELVVLCEQISRNEEELYRCVSGVYNNIANILIIDEKQNLKSLVAERALAICHVQPSQHKESCYGNMNAIFLWSGEDNLEKSLSFVDAIEEPYRESAIRYLSNLSVKHTILKEGSTKNEVDACRRLSNFQIACLEGLVHGLLEHGQPGSEYKQAIKFCNSDALTIKEKEICFQYGFSNLYGWYAADKVEGICAEVPETFRNICAK